MKLSSETVSVLQNFAIINNGIQVKAGNTLRTMSTAKTQLAAAEVAETFETAFCFYDLPQFLGALSTFDNPDLDFGEKQVTISEGATKLTYVYADPMTVVTPPDKNLECTGDIQFTLSEDDLSRLQKASSILDLEDLVITKAGEGQLSVAASDTKNDTTNVFEILVDGDQIPEGNFKAIIKFEHLKLLADDYDVKIASGISQFVGDKAEYFIAVEATSTFE